MELPFKIWHLLDPDQAIVKESQFVRRWSVIDINIVHKGQLGQMRKFEHEKLNNSTGILCLFHNKLLTKIQNLFSGLIMVGVTRDICTPPNLGIF